MIPAPTLDDVLRRADVYSAGGPLRGRLVSVVFANPASVVVSDVIANRAFWDEMTGESWDLFFAGYYAYGSHGDAEEVCLSRTPTEGSWYFSASRFRRFLHDIDLSLPAEVRNRWRFSGGADLLSFMVYGGDPDWLSLRPVDLIDGADAQALGHAIEGLRGWQGEEPSAAYAPGSDDLCVSVPRDALREALKWSAVAIAGGVLGNRADAILDHLLK